MPNLVVLVLDGLQPAYLGPYGNTWVNTPAWNHLAAESLLLERCWLDAPGLADFYRAAWTGQPSWVLRGIGDSGLGIGEEENQHIAQDPVQPLGLAISLPAALTARGYRTVLLNDDPALAALPGADDFDERIELPTETLTAAAEDWTETALAHFFAAASDTLDSLREPFALWLHTGALGRVWDAPYEYRARFAEEDDPAPPAFTDPPHGAVPANADPDLLLGIRQAYAGQIALLDECLGTFLQAWDHDPRAKETWLVVLSARGYPLGEHRALGWSEERIQGSGFRVQEESAELLSHEHEQPSGLAIPPFAGHELLHSAAFLRAPDRARATERSAALAQPSDVWATVAEMLNLDVQMTASANESSSNHWPTGSWWSAPLFSPEWYARDRMFIAAGSIAQVQTAQWWFCGGIPQLAFPSPVVVHGDQERLYLLPEDYFGVNNVASRCPEEVAAFTELLAAWSNARAEQEPSLALQPLAEVLTETVM